MLLFEIHVNPKPQKQTRFGKKIAYDPSKQQRLELQWQIAPYAPREPLKTPLSVDMMFYLPIPKNTTKRLRNQMINQSVLPIKRPDVDNLAYIVTNAMKSIVYEDDSQVVDLILRKRYSEQPRIVVKVTELCD